MNKVINNGYIIAVSTGNTGEQISEAEYRELVTKIQSSPSAPDGFTYKLKADTLEWELVELPPIDDTDDEATESDYITALQDLGVEVN